MDYLNMTDECEVLIKRLVHEIEERVRLQQEVALLKERIEALEFELKEWQSQSKL